MSARNRQSRQSLPKAPGLKDGERTVKKLVLAAGFLAIAMSTAWAQVYVYPSVPYGYGAGYYNHIIPYAPQPYVVPPGYYSFYGFDPTANNWEYYVLARRDVVGTRSQPVR